MSLKARPSLQIVLAMTMVLGMVMAFAVPAQAAVGGNGSLYLLNNGHSSLNATTDWRFYVEKPAYLSLTDSYWNFTVYGEMVNNSGSAATGTYVVTIYIYDGTTNISATSGNIAVSKTHVVYGNVSFANAAIDRMTSNITGHVTCKLTLTGAQKDIMTFHTPISKNAGLGLITGFIGTFVVIVLIIWVIDKAKK